MKELADIRANGTPEGIAAYSIDSMQEWIFTISVLGDETVYRVCQWWSRAGRWACPPYSHSDGTRASRASLSTPWHCP